MPAPSMTIGSATKKGSPMPSEESGDVSRAVRYAPTAKKAT